jgi:hypothetical protein
MKIDGQGTYIGMTLAGVLSLVVIWSDSVSASDTWVATAFTLIGTFTGFRARMAVKKAEK